MPAMSCVDAFESPEWLACDKEIPAAAVVCELDEVRIGTAAAEIIPARSSVVASTDDEDADDDFDDEDFDDEFDDDFEDELDEEFEQELDSEGNADADGGSDEDDFDGIGGADEDGDESGEMEDE